MVNKSIIIIVKYVTYVIHLDVIEITYNIINYRYNIVQYDI